MKENIKKPFSSHFVGKHLNLAIVDKFSKGKQEKRNKENSFKVKEGKDYIKLFENQNSKGTEYLYLPLTWNGSKYLASDYFLPKIKVPPKMGNVRSLDEEINDKEALSSLAQWGISLWTVPSLVIGNKPFKDLDGKEFRHEGKRYWLDYTKRGYYFLFYFRDYNNLEDKKKKVSFTLFYDSPKIIDITLADGTSGIEANNTRKIQRYWNTHYKEYKSRILHNMELALKEGSKFEKYEIQKEEEARNYYYSHKREYILKDLLTYNEETGRYDSKGSLYINNVMYLVKDGDFIIPLGVINGNFECHESKLKTLRNGPTEVKGDFDCSLNELKSLEGAPKEVGGSFKCTHNKLKSLEGAPYKIGGDFDCRDNPLQSMKAFTDVKGRVFWS